MTTYNKARDVMLAATDSSQIDWRPPAFTGDSMKDMLQTLNEFRDYVIPFTGCLFVENEFGVAWITAISDTAIRVSYVDGDYVGDHEWVEKRTFMGNMNATTRTFVTQ